MSNFSSPPPPTLLGLQHARPPCPSPSSGACSNSCSLSRWWHPTISSSVVPFSSCPQSFPASGYFPMNQFFSPGGQNIGASTLNQSFQWIYGSMEKWKIFHFLLLNSLYCNKVAFRNPLLETLNCLKIHRFTKMENWNRLWARWREVYQSTTKIWHTPGAQEIRTQTAKLKRAGYQA